MDRKVTMWDSALKIIQSGDSWFLIIIALLTIMCVRQGLFRYRSEKILFGKDAGEAERMILKSQIEYAYRMCQGFANQIPRFEGFDDFRAKYIIELCYDEMIKWIYFNHIAAKDTYISQKQDIIWSIIQSNVAHKKLSSDQFKKQVDERVEHIIRYLVTIREEYNQVGK